MQSKHKSNSSLFNSLRRAGIPIIPVSLARTLGLLPTYLYLYKTDFSSTSISCSSSSVLLQHQHQQQRGLLFHSPKHAPAHAARTHRFHFHFHHSPLITHHSSRSFLPSTFDTCLLQHYIRLFPVLIPSPQSLSHSHSALSNHHVFFNRHSLCSQLQGWPRLLPRAIARKHLRWQCFKQCR